MLSSQSSKPASSLQPAANVAPVSGRRDIAALVRRQLSSSAYLPLRSVWCDFHEGVLCLRGHVPSFYLKQVAQTIACQVDGVEECMNRIEVGINRSDAVVTGE